MFNRLPFRKTIAIGAMLAVGAGITAVNVASANAASVANPCATSGYSLVHTYPVSGATANTTVYWNPSNKNNCVAVMRTDAGHAKESMSVSLSASGQKTVTDSGSYGYYAGPVRIYAPGCITIKGSVNGHAISEVNVSCSSSGGGSSPAPTPTPVKSGGVDPNKGGSYPAVCANSAKDSIHDYTCAYYPNRECTSFVAWKVRATEGINVPTNLGNASDWGNTARADGYVVNNTPTVGSVGWISGHHVAYVVAVSSTKVTVEQYNYDTAHSGHYSVNTYSRSNYTAYIHFNQRA